MKNKKLNKVTDKYLNLTELLLKRNLTEQETKTRKALEIKIRKLEAGKQKAIELAKQRKTRQDKIILTFPARTLPEKVQNATKKINELRKKGIVGKEVMTNVVIEIDSNKITTKLIIRPEKQHPLIPIEPASQALEIKDNYEEIAKDLELQKIKNPENFKKFVKCAKYIVVDYEGNLQAFK